MNGQPPVVPPSVPATPKTCGLATASLVLGILGLICILPLIGSLLAIIFGIVALVKVSNSRGALRGQGQAIAGLLLGCASLLMIPVLAGMLLPALSAARWKARETLCFTQMKQLGLAVAIYSVDHEDKIPRTFTDLEPYLGSNPGLAKLLICPEAKDQTSPSYELFLGGEQWQGTGTVDQVVIAAMKLNHRGRRNVLYGDGRVETVRTAGE